VLLDADQCYGAVKSRDARFDGWFVVAVTSTGIYCRPSCPAVTPKRSNVRFYPASATAQREGFRACKRCRPDASPGSPEWNTRADLVGRAMRLIADGVVDRDGVGGVARRLAVSERHLHRLLAAEVGAGPLALARAQRAQTARVLLETTDLPITQLAFAAGFASVRQFNDTVRDVFATTPTGLRQAGHRRSEPIGPGALSLRLPYRAPMAAAATIAFLGARAVPGVEAVDGDTYRRTLRLPHAAGTVRLTPADGYLACTLRLGDLRDVAAAVQRCRRLFDLDADPVAVVEALVPDPLIGPLVVAEPGRRSPGHVDGAELAVRAVLGQQVSVSGARTLAGRLTRELGEPLGAPEDGLTHLFPTAGALAGAGDAALPMPAARRRAVRELAAALAAGDVVIDAGADRADVEQRLARLPGMGPWTTAYIVLRGLGDPDAFLPSDLGVRRALEALGQPADPVSASRLAERWRPWRAYALHHLWAGTNLHLRRSA
jgi:AraC family transcriptional regulator of adaptative response / DNA-3-methyladenine glycosylase II